MPQDESVYIGLTVYKYSYATEGCRFSHDIPVSSIKNQNCHNYYEQLYYILFVCSYTVFNPVGKIFVIFNNLKIFFNNLVTREADSPFAHIFRSWCPLCNIYCQFYSSILWSFDIYLFFFIIHFLRNMYFHPIFTSPILAYICIVRKKFSMVDIFVF